MERLHSLVSMLITHNTLLNVYAFWYWCSLHLMERFWNLYDHLSSEVSDEARTEASHPLCDATFEPSKKYYQQHHLLSKL